MKLPTVAFLFVTGFLLILTLAFRPLSNGPGPENGRDRGRVMGQDFTALLSNPFVGLRVERAGDTVYFAWTSESEARLEEVLRLGEHMQSVKRELEMRQEEVRPKSQASVSRPEGARQ